MKKGSSIHKSRNTEDPSVLFAGGGKRIPQQDLSVPEDCPYAQDAGKNKKAAAEGKQGVLNVKIKRKYLPVVGGSILCLAEDETKGLDRQRRPHSRTGIVTGTNSWRQVEKTPKTKDWVWAERKICLLRIKRVK